MKIYYISDLHFSHENIIKLCNRPYKTIEEMDEDIINKWNSIVTPNDVVRILGDVALARSKDDVEKAIKLVKRLNGNKSLIVGNHDAKLLKDERFRQLFSSIKHYSKVTDSGRKVILSHYPIEEWDGFYKGYIHLHGHVHNNDVNLKKINNRYNVSLEVLGYKPRTLDELINRKLITGK